jgi:hypothetical protein
LDISILHFQQASLGPTLRSLLWQELISIMHKTLNLAMIVPNHSAQLRRHLQLLHLPAQHQGIHLISMLDVHQPSWKARRVDRLAQNHITMSGTLKTCRLYSTSAIPAMCDFP